MQRFEYHVIPAPRRGEKVRGAKTTEERFAFALTQLMNRFGAEGWEYVRADVLPCDERVGLTGSKTSYQNMLVFRRALPDQDDVPEFTSLRTDDQTAAPAALRLGPAQVAVGVAPALGPASHDLAAE